MLFLKTLLGRFWFLFLFQNYFITRKTFFFHFTYIWLVPYVTRYHRLQSQTFRRFLFTIVVLKVTITLVDVLLHSSDFFKYHTGKKVKSVRASFTFEWNLRWRAFELFSLFRSPHNTVKLRHKQTSSSFITKNFTAVFVWRTLRMVFG